MRSVNSKGFFLLSLVAVTILASFWPVATSEAEDDGPSAFWSQFAATSRNDTNHDQLIADFLQVAFNNSMWMDNSKPPSAALLPFRNYLNHQSSASLKDSWLGDFPQRQRGLPAHDRIVKWIGPISVGIGWPRFGPNYSEATPPDLETFAGKSVKSAIKNIGSAIPLPIEYVSSNDPRETTSNFAKIRIVFLPKTGLRNHFKFLNHEEKSSSENWYSGLVESYLGAIPFTPKSPTEVDGFLLPNADNSLGLAVCRIAIDLPRPVISDLINECLVRALGLSEQLSRPSTGVLSPWNAAYAVTEVPLDGRAWHPHSDAERLAYYSHLPTTPTAPTHAVVSEQDKQQLSILYCSAIKIGMDKYQAAITLLSDNSCFQH